MKFKITRQELKQKIIQLPRNLYFMIKNNQGFVVALIIAAVIRIFIFLHAVIDYNTIGSPWLGNGSYTFLGITIHFEFEGYTDYSFYYTRWVDAFINGAIPYASQLDNLWYFYPPMYLYIITLGRLILPVNQFWDVGVVIALLDYLMAFPVYGIANNIFHNKKYATIAAISVLFNPINLFYSTYLWLNTPVFIFFWLVGFYFMTKEQYKYAAIFIGIAAMTKQIAFFLVLPLLAAALKKEYDKIDLYKFIKTIIILAATVLIISTPYIFINVDYIHDIISKASGFLYTDLDKLPNYSSPIQFEIPFIFLNAPLEIRMALAILVATDILLLITLLNSFYFMLMTKKETNNDPMFYRKLLFITMIMFMLVHLFSPRGCYKYYWVAITPFWALFNYPSAFEQKSNINIKGASIGFLKVISFSLIIMMLSRYIYLLSGLFIIVIYVIEYMIKNKKEGYYEVEFY